jgi:hypothetical protein
MTTPPIPAPAEPVEEAFVLVPREPTREMWAAMGNALVGYRQRHHDKVAADLWPAVLAAAPPPPGGEGGQEHSSVSPLAAPSVVSPSRGTEACDLEVLRGLAERIERLFDNASKVAAHNTFGAVTADQCAREADAVRGAIVEIETRRGVAR